MGRTPCLICNCDATMTPDMAALKTVPGLEPGRVHTQLCRAQLGHFEAALELAGDGSLIVACTQEAPLFEEIATATAAGAGAGAALAFVNIRETAGWSGDGAAAGPKMAALVAAAMVPVTPARAREITSDGLCLIYGRGQEAVDAAILLAPRLSVTLMLSGDADPVLPPVLDFPVFRGRVTRVTGSFGRFDLVVDGYAALKPSSRGGLVFEDGKDGARSGCALILDVSGGAPLVTGHQKRDGYAKADPRDPAAVLRAAFELSDMVGTFEKPLYVANATGSCAHARSRITGCSKCLDACPAGAITGNGDAVAVDPGICGGCGICAAVCPTGAISYHYPSRPDRLAQAQAMLDAYRAAGGRDPVLLIHDGHGERLIGAMARYGDGLPAEVIPWSRHSATGVGHLELCALVAAGAAGVVVLTDPAQAAELPPLRDEIALAETILAGLGAGAGRVHLIEAADPDRVASSLRCLGLPGARNPARIVDTGGVRDAARVVFAALGGSDAVLALPDGAPYGSVEIDRDACTLCMACASACPTGAMMDTPDEPRLRFAEMSCVQCGLCAATCPETALRLVPRLSLAPEAAQPVTLKHEPPFDCVECGKPFATRSTIARIKGQLGGQHAMFRAPERARLIEMCDDCRVRAQAGSTDDPFALGARPRVRVTEDYLSDAVAEFLMEDGTPPMAGAKPDGPERA